MRRDLSAALRDALDVVPGVAVWWDQKSMESRGPTFLTEIRQAIGDASRLVDCNARIRSDAMGGGAADPFHNHARQWTDWNRERSLYYDSPLIRFSRQEVSPSIRCSQLAWYGSESVRQERVCIVVYGEEVHASIFQ
jgi:hypothetical protein